MIDDSAVISQESAIPDENLRYCVTVATRQLPAHVYNSLDRIRRVIDRLRLVHFAVCASILTCNISSLSAMFQSKHEVDQRREVSKPVPTALELPQPSIFTSSRTSRAVHQYLYGNDF